MELSKGEIATLSRFFRDDKRLSLVVKGKLKNWLNENFDLYHNGKAFNFKAAAKAKLRADIEQSFPNLNIRQGLPQGLNRIEATRYVNDDKLADVRPNDNYVLATSHSGNIVTLGGSLSLPAGASLRLPIVNIDYSQLDSLIIVENQDVFDAWYRANLPLKYQSSLVIYRGNDRTVTSGVKTLLASIPAQAEVLMFPDFDPKGLEISFTTLKVSAILAPSINDIQTHLLTRSQHKKFVLQQDSVSFLKKQTPGNWQSLVEYLLDNKLAIMQQAMIALEVPLQAYPR